MRSIFKFFSVALVATFAIFLLGSEGRACSEACEICRKEPDVSGLRKISTTFYEHPGGVLRASPGTIRSFDGFHDSFMLYEVRLEGWYVDETGYPVLRKTSGDYVYGSFDGYSIRPTNLLYGHDDPSKYKLRRMKIGIERSERGFSETTFVDSDTLRPKKTFREPWTVESAYDFLLKFDPDGKKKQ